MNPVSETLTSSLVREFFHYDPKTGFFTRLVKRSNRDVGSVAGSPDKLGYLTIWIKGRSYKAHRLAWLYVTGEWPKGHIDHINGITHDNSWSNLRNVCVAENLWNARKAVTNTSGIKGVCWDKNRSLWMAKLRVNGEHINLGRFETKEEARRAVVSARMRLHKEFANHG